MNELQKNVLTPGGMLAAFALLAAVLLSAVFNFTRPQVALNERNALLQQLNQLVSPEHYDNDLLAQPYEFPEEAFASFNSADPIKVYRATLQDQPVAALFITTAPNGYSGRIRLVVAVNNDQTLAGVRVLAHKETPGLGDKVEVDKSDWIHGFQAKSLSNPTEAAWAVRKDGGEFDQFTGATITPRAIVQSVKNVLLWSQQHYPKLFDGSYADYIKDKEGNP